LIAPQFINITGGELIEMRTSDKVKLLENILEVTIGDKIKKVAYDVNNNVMEFDIKTSGKD